MKRLLITVSAIASLAAPAAAFAQDNHDQGLRPDQRPAAPVRPVPVHPVPVRPVPVRPVPGHPASGTVMRVDPRAAVTTRPVWTRGDPTWWRSRPEFRGYAGVRPGYWFRPGFGYVRVDPRWYGYSWRVGGYVPLQFRTFYVQSPYQFGLPPAPYGYVYVYLGPNVALMAQGTGLIVQVFPNIY